MNDIQGMPPGGWTDVFELTITRATSERVSANWTVGPRLHGLFGTLHGGSHSSVAESLASIGASLWFGDRGTVAGTANNTDMFLSVTAGRLYSDARPIDQTDTEQLWDIGTRDAADQLVARSQVRLANLTPRTSSTAKVTDARR